MTMSPTRHQIGQVPLMPLAWTDRDNARWLYRPAKHVRVFTEESAGGEVVFAFHVMLAALTTASDAHRPAPTCCLPRRYGSSAGQYDPGRRRVAHDRNAHRACCRPS